MHKQIELALCGLDYDTAGVEMQHFHELVARELIPRGFRLWRAEWSIYDSSVMVAGQIDALFIDPAGAYHMVDWKRCKRSLDPAANARFDRYGKGPCKHLLDNDYTHYCLQQNLYAAILRRRYDIVVSSMSLAQLHPDQASSCLISVPSWSCLADHLLDREINQIRAF